MKLLTLVTEQKVPFVQQGTVDLTVSAVSMTCERWRDVDFSSPYLTTDQQVLLRADSSVTSLAGLAHRKVCVTTGSTTLVTLREKYPDIIEVVKPARTDCLVALQDGEVEGIASHTTILYGLNQQDQNNTKFLNESISKPNYGIAVAKTADHEFARFVNGVLEQIRDNGELERLYKRLDPRRAPPRCLPRPRTGTDMNLDEIDDTLRRLQVLRRRHRHQPARARPRPEPQAARPQRSRARPRSSGRTRHERSPTSGNGSPASLMCSNGRRRSAEPAGASPPTVTAS